MIDKQYLIDGAVFAILGNKGQLQYQTAHQVLQGKVNWPIEQIAIFCLEGSIIYHNIPEYKKTGGTVQRVLRDHDKCFSGFLMMCSANRSEIELVEKSQTGFETYKLGGSYILPKLSFNDNSHEILKSGSGGPLPDFIGSDKKTYEAKYHYQNGSPSSLHNADYLINCDNPMIAVYPVYNNHANMSKDTLLSSYFGILSPRYTTSNLGLDDETIAVLRSGELIEPVEKIIREQTTFKWNN